jgi:hypothetical protein
VLSNLPSRWQGALFPIVRVLVGGEDVFDGTYRMARAGMCPAGGHEKKLKRKECENGRGCEE